MTDPNQPKIPRISEEGQIYVTLLAAEQWADARRIRGIEEARRQLTELLLHAHRSAGDPDMIRYRKKSQGVDIQARVIREGELLVITRINVRPY